MPKNTDESENAVVPTESTADEAKTDDDDTSMNKKPVQPKLPYRYENGRRYHNLHDGLYLLPNDQLEEERLATQHQFMLVLFDGKLQLAPLKDDIEDVLDITTGTGCWAIEFADTHPGVRVIGTDISPIQPHWLPSNCSFVVEDSEADWKFDHQFDFIHSRGLVAGWKNWEKYIKQAYKFLKPGGCIELDEFIFPVTSEDGSAWSDNKVIEWSKLVMDAASHEGVDMSIGQRLPQLLEEAGFTCVNTSNSNAPLNVWNACEDERLLKLGALSTKNLVLKEGLSSISMRLLINVKGWSRTKFDRYMTEVRQDFTDASQHLNITVVTVWAVKPVEES